MCRIASLFLLQKLKENMSGDLRAISTTLRRELSSSFLFVCLFVFFFARQAPKEIHAILGETLREHAPSCSTVKNWVAQFKRGDFSTSVTPRPGRHKTVTTPEIIDQSHELILKDRRISAKSIAEQLDILRERVGSIIHEDLDRRKLSLREVGLEMPERGSKTSTVRVI